MKYNMVEIVTVEYVRIYGESPPEYVAALLDDYAEVHRDATQA